MKTEFYTKGDLESLSGDGDSITSADLTGELKAGIHHSHRSRKVPKVFGKEAITKLRAWLFQNLTVNIFLPYSCSRAF
jgi:hypothetical protein